MNTYHGTPMPATCRKCDALIGTGRFHTDDCEPYPGVVVDPSLQFADAKPGEVCMWCDQSATVIITDDTGWVDWACPEHLAKHFGVAACDHGTPVTRVGGCPKCETEDGKVRLDKVIGQGVGVESVGQPKIHYPGHREGMADNDLITFASLLRCNALRGTIGLWAGDRIL